MNTSRGESSFLGQSGNGLRMYAPHIPINFAEQLSQYARNTSTPYSNRNATPESVSVIITTTSPAEDERETLETTRRGRQSVFNSVSNLHSAKPSPDEIVIKGRGRRSLPLKWSPIPIESPQKAPMRTPIKKSSKKGLIALRSSPRKRLQLNDASACDLIQSRKSLLNSSPLTRKSLEPETEAQSSKVVDDLSKDQLVKVLNSIIKKHPQIKEEIGTMLDTTQKSDNRNNKNNNNNNNVSSDVI